MKRLLLLLAVLGIAWYLALPPRAPAPPAVPAGMTTPVRGAIHVHTRLSDGSGTPDTIAAAAARAGLRFVVLTDHGDGVRRPAAPRYHDGVLLIDALEISTEHGHVVALGMPQAPYPLGGEGRDVVDDIARLGGFSIAAHPTSAKEDLRWTDDAASIGGLEWLNADSEWRDEPALRLMQALFAYPGRPAEAVVALLDRPQEALQLWDRLARERQVVGLAALDAHARLGMDNVGEPYESRAVLPVPSYDAMFRAFSISLPDLTLTRDAAVDAAAVVRAIAAGRVYSTIDAVGGPAALSFSAQSGQHRAVMGGVLPLDGPVALNVATHAPANARIVLLRDGREVAAASGATLEHTADASPASYRVEVHLPGAPGDPQVPWIVTNPIYVGLVPPPPSVPAPRTTTAVQYEAGPPTGWSVETGARSQGAIDELAQIEGSQLGFRYAISGTASQFPYAAMVMQAGQIAGYDRLVFTARAARPMRLSVQLRAPSAASPLGERWRRSVVLDSEPREITVMFDDMRPVGAATPATPPLERVTAVLFVVDTVNAELGSSGTFDIDDVRYAR